MAKSKATKHIDTRYKKQNVEMVFVPFSANDKMLLGYLDTQDARATYIKDLIHGE